MSEFQIFSDGAADIPLTEAAEKNIKIIPFYVSFDAQKYYKELVELSLDVFYDKIINEKVFPKTSLPSITDYSDAFEEALKEGKDVLCFTITDTLSGSFQSATTAKQLLEEKYPDRKIYILNSFHATGSQMLLINEAVKMQQAGLSIDEVYRISEETKNDAGIIFMVGGLEHLKKGGRIGRLTALSGSILKIKPMIHLKDGYIDTAGVVRSRKAGIKKNVELIKAFFEKNNLNVSDYIFTIGSTNTPEEFEPLTAEIKAVFPDAELSPASFQIGATIGAHTGPDTLGICYARKFKA